MNEETFRDYMFKLNPNWQTLPMETIQKAIELFNLKNDYEQMAKTLLQRQFSSSADIDYTTDYEKNNEKLVKTRARLENLVKPLDNTNDLINMNSKTM